MAVLLGVGQTEQLSVRQTNLARALDLHRIQGGEVVYPHDGALRGKDALIDLGASVVRNDALAIDAHAQLLVPNIRLGIGDVEHVGFLAGGGRRETRARGNHGATFDARKDLCAKERSRNAARIHVQQIVGNAVDRIYVWSAVATAAAQQRFVVAGDDTGGGLVFIVNLVERKLPLAIKPDVVVVARVNRDRASAWPRPGGAVREHGAARTKCLPCFRQAVVAPSGKIAEARWYEIGVLGPERSQRRELGGSRLHAFAPDRSLSRLRGRRVRERH